MYKLLSLAWIGSRTFIFIDVSEQAHVIDVQSTDELEVVDLANIGLAYSTDLWKSLGNSTGVSRALSQSGDRLCYESVASFGTQLVILGVTDIHVFSVRTWIERLNVLVRRRQFGDALVLARSFYNRAASSCADGSSDGGIKRREAVTERILELLAKYMEHVDAVSILQNREANSNQMYHVGICSVAHRHLHLLRVLFMLTLLFGDLKGLLACRRLHGSNFESFYMPRLCPSVHPSVLRHIPVFCRDE